MHVICPNHQAHGYLDGFGKHAKFSNRPRAPIRLTRAHTNLNVAFMAQLVTEPYTYPVIMQQVQRETVIGSSPGSAYIFLQCIMTCIVIVICPNHQYFYTVY